MDANANSKWKIISDVESTDGAYRNVRAELWMDFEPTRWNENTKSPVVSIHWHDKKTITSWKIDQLKTWVSGKQRHVTVQFDGGFFQRMPNLKVYSNYEGGMSEKMPRLTSYEDFTVEHAMDVAVAEFKRRLMSVYDQL